MGSLLSARVGMRDDSILAPRSGEALGVVA
jgi:hypothetical protein